MLQLSVIKILNKKKSKTVYFLLLKFLNLEIDVVTFQLTCEVKWSEVKWSEVAQSCPTLCGPMDCSLPGSSVHGIFQARILEWVAISFSRGSSWPRDWTRVSHIVGRHFTVWATREAPPTYLGISKFSKSLGPTCFSTKRLGSCISPHLGQHLLLFVYVVSWD